MNIIQTSAIWQCSWVYIAVGLVAKGMVRAEGVAVSTVQDNALRNARGIMAVNVAAGDTMTQFNGLGIALSEGVLACTSVKTHQRMQVNPSTEEPLALAVTYIMDGSFVNAGGLVAINQAAGHGNAQANGVAMARGSLGAAIIDYDREKLQTKNLYSALALKYWQLEDVHDSQ